MQYDQGKEMLQVSVTDTGAGIEEHELSKIFEKFTKVQRTESVNEEGLGIGLSICKHIIEQSGGELQVFSKGKDRGATFTFTMKMTMMED